MHPDTSKEMVYKNYKNKLVPLIRTAKQIYYEKKIDKNKTNTLSILLRTSKNFAQIQCSYSYLIVSSQRFC